MIRFENLNLSGSFVEECFKMCIANQTDLDALEDVDETTETAYIQGATARQQLSSSFREYGCMG